MVNRVGFSPPDAGGGGPRIRPERRAARCRRRRPGTGPRRRAACRPAREREPALSLRDAEAVGVTVVRGARREPLGRPCARHRPFFGPPGVRRAAERAPNVANSTNGRRRLLNVTVECAAPHRQLPPVLAPDRRHARRVTDDDESLLRRGKLERQAAGMGVRLVDRRRAATIDDHHAAAGFEALIGRNREQFEIDAPRVRRRPKRSRRSAGVGPAVEMRKSPLGMAETGSIGIMRSMAF